MQANRKKTIDYAALRNSRTCFCGRHKWRGFAFCRSCQERLSPALRVKLFGEFGERYGSIYEECKAELVDMGVKDFAETGKL